MAYGGEMIRHDYFGWPEFILDTANFLFVDSVGPQEIVELGQDAREEEKLLEKALNFVVIDSNSPFYADPEDDYGEGNYRFYMECREKLISLGIRSVRHLKEQLQDSYPNKFNANQEDVERIFYEKAVQAYDLLEK